MGFLEKLGLKKKETLDKGVEKSRDGLLNKIGKAFVGKDKVDDAILDDLEEILITSDVGVNTTIEIIKKIEARVAKDKYVSQDELQTMLRQEIVDLLEDNAPDKPAEFEADFPIKPHIILVVGVNGVGKTTTIGKLAHLYKKAGKKVILGAADTFRAAAVNQLKIWSERADVPIIQQGQNADPASVAYDTVAAAKARGSDVALIDTAGRLHNKKALMEELAKIKRVMGKVVEGAPHEVILVLDASTGQNAMQQAKAFTETVDITGLALTKLDGTAKGGIVIGVSNELNVPVKYIGLGEKIEDLQVFDRANFVNALFGE
ncbi:MAG: signal recognition particle-docking protein FtsY [Balneola sp.]|jgi:fused signal recognition particle receptor|nr:signal recognition particle-docking protein FtsY [Balneola sp.]MBE80081.1 signal recognition particle-docking protein FtsY [Balneola sp.]HBX64836.1 signal recognition particle-docking protein FtsY [Balneolaceae bacterium]|tara:strand:+ start:243 stop:1196 length:954 start_codon:yes stop_codon:yes gene_type:complete